MFISYPLTALDTRIATHCKRHRIPVNVTDAPSLCTFKLPSLYSDGPLQVGITTSGMGCKLAARIRRQILAVLPPNLGQGIQRLGSMRRKLIEENHAGAINGDLSDDESTGQKSDFAQLATTPASDSIKQRRLRWLSQICEHWPLHRLASIDDNDIETLLASYASSVTASSPARARPRIILAGSGPGSPHLLTVATRRAIETAGVILSDKLVPSAVLDLIPRRTPVHIAEKFPGNADAAQRQLLELGLQALQQGHTVLRLKQGDPYIYGRGGEEVNSFRAAGYEPLVLPALTSALAAPLCAAIPLTQRGVADDIRICTGVGRKGIPPTPPGYAPSQTVVVLMVLNRLRDFVTSLIGDENARTTNVRDPASQHDASETKAIVYSSPPWPPDTPCAIIERASCSDQRVVRSTLRHIVTTFEETGSRPPGLLVLGRACEILNSNVKESEDRGENGENIEMASRPRYTVEEGYADLESWMREVDVPLHAMEIENTEIDGVELAEAQATKTKGRAD
jgi:uroporphyrin-III C-methyltransferase